MPNKVQLLRSSVTGARPTGRLPGEPYVNWADKMLGVADASGNPIDLLPVTWFSNQASYGVGAICLESGALYRSTVANGPGAFNPAQWEAFAVGALDYLPLTAGPTSPLTGKLFSDNEATFLGAITSNEGFWVRAANTSYSPYIAIEIVFPALPLPVRFLELRVE